MRNHSRNSCVPPEDHQRLARDLLHDDARRRQLVAASPGVIEDLLVNTKGSPNPTVAGLSDRLEERLRRDASRPGRSAVSPWRVGRIFCNVRTRLERHQAVLLAARLAGRDGSQWNEGGERRPTYDPKRGRSVARSWTAGVSRCTPGRTCPARPGRVVARRRSSRVARRRLHLAIGPPATEPDPPELSDALAGASARHGVRDVLRPRVAAQGRHGLAYEGPADPPGDPRAIRVAAPAREEEGGSGALDRSTPARPPRLVRADARPPRVGPHAAVPSCTVQCRGSGSAGRPGGLLAERSRDEGVRARGARRGLCQGPRARDGRAVSL